MTNNEQNQSTSMNEVIDERAQQLLRFINDQQRKNQEGKLKIFLGMVAGVGKTFAMLREAHELKKNGTNVAIGIIETHGRKETEALVQGIPFIPKKIIPYKGKEFSEMDLDAILQTRPEIILVDELAHTNIPGVRHTKRYQDVLELLHQGIDVFTTLNVQHIESCAGTVTEITNIPVYETIPDSLIDRADEIILIDLAPEKVIARLHEGKIYPADKIQSSLENFFVINNLTALREMVLRLLADRVNSDLRNSTTVMGVPQIWKTGHRLLVPIGPFSNGEKMIRATRRLASGLNANWTAGFVDTGKKLTPEEQNCLKKNMDMAKQLGADVFIINDNHAVNGLMRLVHNHHITQVILGKHFQQDFEEMIRLGKIDVLFLAETIQDKTKKKRFFLPLEFDSDDWRGLSLSFIGLGILCFIYLFFLPMTPYQLVGIVSLLFVQLMTLFSGRLSTIFISLFTAFCWIFFLVPPAYSFRISSTLDSLILIGYFMTIFVSSILHSKIRSKDKSLLATDERLSILYFLTENMAETRGVEKIVRLILDKIFEMFPVQAGVFLVKDGESKKLEQNVIGNIQLGEKEFHVANWAFLNKKSAGRFTDVLSSVEGLYIPLIGGVSCYGVLGVIPNNQKSLSGHQILTLEDIAKHFALGLEREVLSENLQKSKINEAIEKVYKTLLDSISYELKTPLTSIKQMATELLSLHEVNQQDYIQEKAKKIVLGTHRMQLLIQNLLDMGSIESGKIVLKQTLCDLKTMLLKIFQEMELFFEKREFKMTFHQQQESLQVFVDEKFFEQAIKNIIQNACLYGPVDKPIEITISKTPFLETVMTIRDHGPGLPEEDPSLVFQKFYRSSSSTGGSGLGLTISKAIIEMHGGEISAQNAIHGGAQFMVKLPITNPKAQVQDGKLKDI
jgi:two-component system sensor histidine kinase KdpD